MVRMRQLGRLASVLIRGGAMAGRVFTSPYRLAAIGDGGDRTPDIVLAKHALSQLSYIPLAPGGERTGRTWIRTKDLSFIRAAL